MKAPQFPIFLIPCSLALVTLSLPGCKPLQMFGLTKSTQDSGDGDERTESIGAQGTGESAAIQSPPEKPTLTAGTVEGLKPVLTGTCSQSASHFAASSAGMVRSVECKAGKLSVLVHLPAGSDPFTLTVTSSNALGKVDSGAINFTRTPFSCPEGYVGVPGSGINGLGSASAKSGHESPWLNTDKDFCVMKYPAKDNGSGVATSVAAGKPWYGISRGKDESVEGSAFKACKDAGPGYRLISNTQWQTIARNAESVPTNWSEGLVGKGSLARGHSDNSAGTLPAGKDDDGYFGTGNSGKDEIGKGWEEKRTRFLSNGEVVWDFGGNVWQWVSDDVTSLGVQGEISEEWSDFNFEKNPSLKSDVNRLLFAPANSSDDSKNSGRIAGGRDGAILRGGYCTSGKIAGLFTVSLNGTQDEENYFNGFRCVFNP